MSGMISAALLLISTSYKLSVTVTKVTNKKSEQSDSICITNNRHKKLISLKENSGTK